MPTQISLRLGQSVEKNPNDLLDCVTSRAKESNICIQYPIFRLKKFELHFNHEWNQQAAETRVLAKTYSYSYQVNEEDVVT